jgi:hypothetical protein
VGAREGVAVLADIPLELREAYSAFRRDRSHDDVLPAGTTDAFPAFGEPRFGLNADLSRLVRAADGTTAHLVPGDGVLAVIDRGGGGVAGLHQALDGTSVGTSFRRTGRLQVLGLLPDGVDQVAVVRRNGDAITVLVPDHLYAVDVHATVSGELPAEVRFVLGGRERRLRVPGADDEVLSMRSPHEQ